MGIKITKDKVADVLAAVSTLTRNQVLVGIPGENAERQDAPGAKPSPISNVQLGWIHERGSPAQNIPARPFLVPGVRDALPRLLPKLKKAGELALDFKNVSAITQQLTAVGLIAASAVQMKITTGPFQPIADATKRARLYRKLGYRNASEARKQKMMAKWMAGDFKPLLDSGAMRASVTFVIRPK